MCKEKLSKSEICGYCGSKIMWDVEDDNYNYVLILIHPQHHIYGFHKNIVLNISI